ncbi:MAG: VOC family protein [Hyphomicrobiales bacterium]|nr:MAG: VOC family protein [Hyphomicrobiales bacterium]
MTIKTTTHLNFRGQARAALEFYQSVFGGQLAAVTYADAHAVQRPEEANQIMWGQVAAENGFRIMAYDVPAAQPWDAGIIPLFVSIRGTDATELTGLWEKLSPGATPLVPLAKSAWSPLYGMLKDRFGITWVLDIEVAYPG